MRLRAGDLPPATSQGAEKALVLLCNISSGGSLRGRTLDLLLKDKPFGASDDRLHKGTPAKDGLAGVGFLAAQTGDPHPPEGIVEAEFGDACQFARIQGGRIEGSVGLRALTPRRRDWG